MGLSHRLSMFIKIAVALLVCVVIAAACYAVVFDAAALAARELFAACITLLVGAVLIILAVGVIKGVFYVGLVVAGWVCRSKWDKEALRHLEESGLIPPDGNGDEDAGA